MYIIYYFSKGFQQNKISKILGLSAPAIHQRVKKIASVTGYAICSLNDKRKTKYNKSCEPLAKIAEGIVIDLSWALGVTVHID